MDKFYKVLFVIVVIATLFIVGYTFNKTAIKSDFVMIEDEEIKEAIDQSENTIIAQPLENNNFLNLE